MAEYTCCGHDFGTADAYRDHRKQIHGETDAPLPERRSLWQRVIAALRIRS